MNTDTKFLHKISGQHNPPYKMTKLGMPGWLTAANVILGPPWWHSG